MGVLEFIFAVLIIVPVALVMIFIFRKLTGEYNSAIKKERDLRSGKYHRDREFARYAELKDYRKSKLVKLDFMLNGEVVDALSFIVFEERAYTRARKIAEKLKENIPRQLFEIPIQAAIGSKIIARETVKAMRKDVLAKCYGGDITRKKKLLEKQKEGKKKMRKLGSVEVTPEAFMAVLRLDDDN